MSSLAQKMRIISKTHSVLYGIDDDAALRKNHLTLSDYYDCKSLMSELGKPGSSAKTLLKGTADFFDRHGYNVVEKGIGYEIFI